MILNEEFIKVYEELETINEEVPAVEANLTESNKIPEAMLSEVANYIKTTYKWEAKDFNIDDEGEVTIEYDTSKGANPHDERVIDDIGNYAYMHDLNFAIDVAPEGRTEITKVYLDLVTF